MIKYIDTMRILGLDFGSKRIGAAISDELCITAQPLKSITITDPNDAIEEISNIINKFQIKEIVIGLPLNMNGSAGEAAKRVIKFAETIQERFSLPVFLWDERLTTTQAEKLLINAGLKRIKRRSKIDRLAASLILQGFLDSRRNRD
ncbi:MAG: Holliday junction resolvase RuvX [Candidatus Aenigmatarchaeota archaeon]